MNFKLKGLLIICMAIFAVKLNYLFDFQSIDENIFEDAELTVPELIGKYGYTSEIHYTTTDDGYMLEIHRITSSPKCSYINLTKKVVLLMHGFPSSSADWIIAGPNIALGYYLADLGYDVWLGNVRGNRYSRKHAQYLPNESKFWNFTFHELGVYDVPATIDYIIDQTKQAKITYIGFSQGVVLFYVMCSERPEYMNKISHMHSLAPVSSLYRTNNIVLKSLRLFSKIPYLSERIYEFLPHSRIISNLSKFLCNPNSMTKAICSHTLFILNGYSYKQMNHTLLPIFFGHLPAGSSSKVLSHFVQLVNSDRFGQFDYGEKRNLVLYGTKSPPNYDLNRIQVPIALHSSTNDYYVHLNDVKNLSETLPNLIDLFLYSDYKFNHIDFITAIDARKFVYTKVVEVMAKYA